MKPGFYESNKHGHNKHFTAFTQLGAESWLGKRLGKELTDNQQAIIRLVMQDNKMTIKEMAARLGISTTAVENNIKKLRDLKVLEREGGRKEGLWQYKPISN